MAGRHLPADHAKGDANTIGGYASVHGRPAAFEGTDGLSYSVEIVVDRADDGSAPYAAYFLFVRWRRVGQPGVEGHLESDYQRFGQTPDEVRSAIGAMSLSEVRMILHDLIDQQAVPGERRWWDAMRDDTDDSEPTR
ncbi:MAG: hypothetical protein U0132_05485 [Gemmatimonadaceae bacterium]